MRIANLEPGTEVAFFRPYSCTQARHAKKGILIGKGYRNQKNYPCGIVAGNDVGIAVWSPISNEWFPEVVKTKQIVWLWSEQAKRVADEEKEFSALQKARQERQEAEEQAKREHIAENKAICKVIDEACGTNLDWYTVDRAFGDFQKIRDFILANK